MSCPSSADPAPRRRFKLSGKVFKLIEKHLKDADELATKTVMPVHSQGASSVNQNTEQRWLCRMVANASKELKQRVEVDKEIGAAEEEAEDARTSLRAARNEALAKIAALKEEKAELERRVEAVKGRVVEAQREQCRQEERERRPTVSSGVGADGSSAAEEVQPCPPKVELDARQFTVLRTQSKRMGDLLGELSVAMPKRLKSFKDTAHTVMQWLEEEPSELEKVMQKEMPRFNTSTAAGSSSQQQQAAGPPPKAPTTSNSKASSAMPPPSSAGMSRCFTPAGLLAHHIMKQQQLR